MITMSKDEKLTEIAEHDISILGKAADQCWVEMRSTLLDMRKDAKLCDLKLLASDFDVTNKTICAHSAILISTCRFFNQYITNTDDISKGKFLIPTLDTKCLDIVINYLYGLLPDTELEMLCLKKGIETLGVSVTDDLVCALEKYNEEADSKDVNVSVSLAQHGTLSHDLQSPDTVMECNVLGDPIKTESDGNEISVKEEEILSEADIVQPIDEECDIEDIVLADGDYTLEDVGNVSYLLEKRTLKCIFCRMFCANHFDMLRHVRCKHSHLPYFICVACGHASRCSAHLVVHYKEEHDIVASYIELKQVHAVLSNRNIDEFEEFTLLKDGTDVTEDNSRSVKYLDSGWLKHYFYCFVSACKKICSDQSMLLEDIGVHLGAISNSVVDLLTSHSYECDKCGEIMDNQRTLDHHRFREHSDRSSCFICNKRYNTPMSLNTHMLTHQGRMFKCDICNKGFNQKAHLRDHLTSHSSQRNFQCSVCGDTFKFRSALNYHFKRYHDPDFVCKFFCEICGKKEPTQNRLNLHMLKHNRSKDFICSICQKGYKSMKYLETHLKNTHNAVDS